MNHLGAQMRLARKARGLSMAALAAQVGADRMTVQRLEAGQSDPRLSTVEDMLRALGLKLMLVPAPLEQAVAQFIQSQGRVLGQPVGVEAPPSVVDAITRAQTQPGDERRIRRRK